MKKSVTSSKHSKLSLNIETVRLLTSQELSVVVGGACHKASVNTQQVPPTLRNNAEAAAEAAARPTC